MQHDSVRETDKTAENRKIIVNELRSKWGKFSVKELTALTGKDALVSQLQTRYGLSEERAIGQVDELLKGRPF
ncbi:MAG: hypothetical protein WBQ49_04930 [Rhodomicrobium sp.]